MLGKRKENERGRTIVQTIRSQETFVLSVKYKVCDAEVKIEKRFPTMVRQWFIPGTRAKVVGTGVSRVELRWFLGPVVYGQGVCVSSAYITSMDSVKHGRRARLSSSTRPYLTLYLVRPFLSSILLTLLKRRTGGRNKSFFRI